MNTLVKQILSVTAFLCAIGAALASSTANLSSSQPQGFNDIKVACTLGNVSQGCQLLISYSNVCMLKGTSFTAVDPNASDCRNAQAFTKPNP